MEHKTKFIIGKFKYPITLIEEGNRIWVNFGFNKPLINIIKERMEKPRYHGYDTPPRKSWTIENSLRNWFQINLLEGKNPYAWYDKPLLDFKPKRECAYDHQVDMIRHMITRQQALIAAEPAVGKTLAAIEAMEWFLINKGIRGWFYIAPRGALVSVRLEFEQWKSIVQPQFFTYEKLKSLVENWPPGSLPPQGIIFDESQRLKNPVAQRSIAAKHMAHSMLKEYGRENCVIIDLTGTPAPKSPCDFYNQIEILCPGFLQEGSYEKFKKRLAYLDEGHSDSGQTFLQLKGWRDDESKCLTCGKPENDNNHNVINLIEKWYHPYQKSINEVAKLYDRMKGITIVKMKSECLSLPEKIFRIIECKPTQSIINAAKLIVAHGYSVIQTNILLRELSDGFQYKEFESGTETCPLCSGSKIQEDCIYVGPDDKYDEIQQLQEQGQEVPAEYFQVINKSCNYCNGTGQSKRMQREAVQVPCPKEDALKNLIDEYEDIGRLVTYAGFTGSVDRCTQIYLKEGWDVIRVDGRGWWSNLGGDSDSLYRLFKLGQEEHPKVAFVGQPGAGGLGLNLQESQAIIFYSNDFNGESRMQAVERTHRPGNRGTTIFDLCHLPTDKLALDNLNKKKKLQEMSLTEFKQVLEHGISS